jgi:hypothetical protein
LLFEPRHAQIRFVKSLKKRLDAFAFACRSSPEEIESFCEISTNADVNHFVQREEGSTCETKEHSREVDQYINKPNGVAHESDESFPLSPLEDFSSRTKRMVLLWRCL